MKLRRFLVHVCTAWIAFRPLTNVRTNVLLSNVKHISETLILIGAIFKEYIINGQMRLFEIQIFIYMKNLCTVAKDVLPGNGNSYYYLSLSKAAYYLTEN